MTDLQRARILTAMTEVVCERGAANVTVGHAVERAGVSRRTFYELFEDRGGCFLAALDEAVARASRRVLAAYDRDAGWVERIRASLLALLSFLDEEPFAGRLLIVESLGAGPAALKRRRDVLEPVLATVAEGAEEPGARRAGPMPLTAEGVVGGVLAVLHARLSEGRGGPLLELGNSLTSMIVLPYMGQAAAKRELERPLPTSCSPHASVGDLAQLSRLNMRLTYRTISVLMALAANPGSSNRQVAQAAGVTDQGQMSKLLNRLRQLGLIENAGTGGSRGEPNAWTLTSDGWRVQSVLAQQST